MFAAVVACKLLDGSSAAVAAIAHDVGYRDLSNLNRQFLAETAFTPTAYRGRAERRAP